MKIAMKWISDDEISTHPGISKDTVYRWIERGRIPAHKVGKLWKFKATEVDHWVQQGEASEPPLACKDSSIHKKDKGKSE